jgi:hypothetical protein
MWDVPRETHRYMVEELGGQHAQSYAYCEICEVSTMDEEVT